MDKESMNEKVGKLLQVLNPEYYRSLVKIIDNYSISPNVNETTYNYFITNNNTAEANFFQTNNNDNYSEDIKLEVGGEDLMNKSFPDDCILNNLDFLENEERDTSAQLDAYGLEQPTGETKKKKKKEKAPKPEKTENLSKSTIQQECSIQPQDDEMWINKRRCWGCGSFKLRKTGNYCKKMLRKI
jgi:hypothetical protein